MAGDLTIFDEPHHQSLELLSARALAKGDIAAAYRFADRRCRIPPLAEPHCYVLRAEALFRMGEKAPAISDLDKALAIAPDDIAANRRMLAWSEGPRQRKAALALIARDRDFDVVARAIKVLRGDGRETFASVTVLDDVVEGWAAWARGGPLEVSITGGPDRATTHLEPDPFHRLSSRFVRAVSFELPRPKSREPQSVHLSIDGEVFYAVRAPGNESDVSPSDRRPKVSMEPPTGQTAVIVPVYADYEATKACLDSLLDQLTETPHRVIVVNDASPDGRIAKYLARVAAKPFVQVLTNPKNLGFVGAVNRALDHVAGGDIVLLNSDTIVPVGFIDRLAAAARTSADIGTVTPLSNNGEFTSFPVPNRSNPLESPADIARIDEIAAKVNSGKVVDIPNGIGFCLYVTRRCLDAVGFLSESFHRGYLEDVDFCLRARESGFRNVCAPSVYVGHAGSRSFKEEKRSLVVRNLDVIARRFPKYRVECAAFIMADPLRPSREAIEYAAPPRNRRPRLLVTGAGAVGAVVRERARQLSAEAKSVMVVEVGAGASGPTARLREPSGAMPQSVRFDLSSPIRCQSMLDYLRQIRPSRVEIADPVNMPPTLLDLLLDLGVPYDMFIADAGLLCPRATPMSCQAIDPEGRRPNRAPYLPDRDNRSDPDKQEWELRWRAVAKRADRILVPCAQAEAFAARFLPKRKATRVGRAESHRGQRTSRKGKGIGFDLGLIPMRLCPQEQRLMRDIALDFHRSRPNVSILVVGGTLDDYDLMRLGNTFVTGPVDSSEMEEVLRAYGLQSLFLCATRPLFGHPAQLFALNSPLRAAYFDWSIERCTPRKGDLPIDPRSSVGEIVGAISRWMPKP